MCVCLNIRRNPIPVSKAAICKEGKKLACQTFESNIYNNHLSVSLVNIPGRLTRSGTPGREKERWKQSRLDRPQAFRLSSPSPRAKRDKPRMPPSETTRTIGWSGSRGTDAIYFVYTGCPGVRQTVPEQRPVDSSHGADRGRLVFGWPETRRRGVPVERPGAAPGPEGQRRFVGLGKRRVLFPPGKGSLGAGACVRADSRPRNQIVERYPREPPEARSRAGVERVYLRQISDNNHRGPKETQNTRAFRSWR